MGVIKTPTRHYERHRHDYENTPDGTMHVLVAVAR